MGDANSEFFAMDEFLEEPYWAGSHLNLIDTFGYGKFQYRVYDLSTGRLIYSRGYSTLFSEWQTTLEAQDVLEHSKNPLSCLSHVMTSSSKYTAAIKRGNSKKIFLSFSRQQLFCQSKAENGFPCHRG
jgi:hypothetical protein